MRAIFLPFIGFIKSYSYFAEFLLLLACGLGLPIPEEVTLITGGYLCYSPDIRNHLWLTVAICMASILLGDWLMFLLGRKYGKWVLRRKWFRRMLTRRKLARVTLYVRRYGAKTVFFARFFAGLRVPVYFIAGTHHMKTRKFVSLDFMGALLSVPISIWVGKRFGVNIERTIQVMEKVKFELCMGILAGVALYVAWRLWRSKRRDHPRVFLEETNAK